MKKQVPIILLLSATFAVGCDVSAPPTCIKGDAKCEKSFLGTEAIQSVCNEQGEWEDMEDGAEGQVQGICEEDDDLDAAEEGKVVCLGRQVKVGTGSAAFCLETGSLYFMGSDGQWAEVTA